MTSLVQRALGAALVLATAAGCGRGGDTTKTFAAKADSVCADAAQRFFDAYAKDMGPSDQPPPQEKLPGFVHDQWLPIHKSLLADLRALDAPSGDKALYEKFLQSLDDAIAKVEADPNNAFNGGNPFQGPDDLAAKYGMQVCITHATPS